MLNGDVKNRNPSRKHLPHIYLSGRLCDRVLVWDRVHRDVCLCAGSCACVRGRVQNPHVHGLSKNRNPSRKHVPGHT